MSEISPRAPEMRTTTDVHFKDQEGIEFGSISFNQSGTFSKTGFEGTLNSNSVTFSYGASNPTVLYIKGTAYTTETELITFYPHSSAELAEATIDIPDEYLNEKTLQFRITCEKLSVDETWSVSYLKTSDRVTRTGSASFEITSTTENAVIYYTTDGTNPTTESNVYSGSISTTENITVKALATREGLLNSNITSTDIKVKLPDPEIIQEINGDRGTLSLSNSYDSYEGVSFQVSRQETEDYFVTRDTTFPYEVMSNDTYIFQAISAGKNNNSNKVPVDVTELKANDPSIDVDDPEGSFKVEVTVGGAPGAPVDGNTYKAAICAGLGEWLANNTELCTIDAEEAGSAEYRKGAVVTFNKSDNIEESYYLDDISLVMEGKAPAYCYKSLEGGIWVIAIGSLYTIMVYPAGYTDGDISFENETVVFGDSFNKEGPVSLTFNKDIDSVAYVKDSFEMTLTVGGATAMGEAGQEFTGWSGNDFLYWLMYNTTAHQGTEESSSTYMLDGISVSIKDGGTFNKTFDQLITDASVTDIPEGKLGIAHLSRDDAGSLVYKDSGKTNMFYLLFRGYAGADENPLNMDTVYLGTPESGLVAPIAITFTKNAETPDNDTFTVEFTETQSVGGKNVPTKIATGISDFIEANAEWTEAGGYYGATNLSAVVKNGDGTEYPCSMFYKNAQYGLLQSGDDNGKFTFQITYDPALVPDGGPAEIKQNDFCYFMESSVQFTLPVTLIISKLADTDSVTGQLTELREETPGTCAGMLPGFADFLEANTVISEDESFTGISGTMEDSAGKKFTFNTYLYQNGIMYAMMGPEETESEFLSGIELYTTTPEGGPDYMIRDFAQGMTTGLTLPVTVTLTKNT